jgi:hypothetical protein
MMDNAALKLNSDESKQKATHSHKTGSCYAQGHVEQ